MLYRSLNKKSDPVNFEKAIKLGLASDGGLFFPTTISPIKKDFIDKIQVPTKELNMKNKVFANWPGDLRSIDVNRLQSHR